MNGQDFLGIIEKVLSPFLANLGFIADKPSISGKLYLSGFTSLTHRVWVAYEPGDNYLSIGVFSWRDDRYSDIDDCSQTPRLSDLNRRYMHLVTQEERTLNEAAFHSMIARDNDERLLLKAVKELRLVLPKYLHDQESPGRGNKC